mmetsp:Transcript_23472/g.79915  ORF Transcript_23472/g.79915 Transcript_23472/m.79915 type:complete len:199 (+) Transcript_23472:155-751(+)
MAPPARSRKAQYELHDRVNLVVLPLLTTSCALGAAELVDSYAVTVVFTAYIVADLVWVAACPGCVPRAPGLICLHHVVTLALLAHPLRYPEHAFFTCWDGMVELNTALLLARRQTSGWVNEAFNAAYWATMWLLRGAMQPFMLVWIWRAVCHPPYSALDLAVVMTAQLFLCGFNVWLVSKNVGRKPHVGGGDEPAKAR